ncbi:MAG TPA: DUF6249 domain-containing protein [Vicinamibacterales bacterium]|nr:DUF6249 domain-containing protein [Vicinamibacterales bacterium]
MTEDVLFHQLPGIVFTIIAATFALVWRQQNLQRYRTRLELIQKERLIAMEKGVPMPELPDYDAGGRPSLESMISTLRVHPRWPLGAGAILICGGIGTTIALALSRETYHSNVWSMGLIPVFVGVGLFLHYRLTR